ncbi:MAG: hypothetical protein KAJ63_00585 [Methyloprofundus sp.]|nr:hypothetical protein [Methyloprofundus sp.]
MDDAQKQKTHWIENTELYKSRGWDELGYLSRSLRTAAAFLTGENPDKRTTRQVFESVVRIANEELPGLKSGHVFRCAYKTKTNNILDQKDDLLAAYQIGLNMNGVEHAISLDEVVEFVENGQIKNERYTLEA